MDIVGKESCLNTTEHGVNDNTNWEQEAGGNSVHSSERADNSSTTGQQHGRYQDVRHDAEYGEDQMGDGSEASPNDFKEGMGVWSSSLQFDGDGRKEQDLDSSSAGIPEWTTDTIIVSDRRTL